MEQDIMEINIRLREKWLSSLSLLLFMMVIFAHQREVPVETLLRYGSLLFVVAAYFIDYPPLKTENSSGEIHLTEYSLWLLFWMAYLMFSSLWAIQFSNVRATVFNTFKVALVAMIVGPHIKTREDLIFSLKLLLAALCYMLALFALRTPFSAWTTARAGGVLGLHANDWARNCALGSLLSLFLFCYEKRRRWVWLLLVLAFSGFALISGSKNALLIIIFQMGLFILLKSRGSKRLAVILGTFLILVLMLYLTLNVTVLYNIVGYRFERMLIDLGFMPGTANSNGSTGERIFFIQTAWALFKEHPLLGVGCNNFSAYLASIHYHNPKYSHCGFVELPATLGIFGFLLYYLRYLYLLVSLRLKKHFSSDLLSILLFVLVARILVFDFSTISMYTYNNYLLLMFASAALFMDEKDSSNHQSFQNNGGKTL